MFDDLERDLRTIAPIFGYVSVEVTFSDDGEVLEVYVKLEDKNGEQTTTTVRSGLSLQKILEYGELTEELKHNILAVPAIRRTTRD